MKFGRGQPIGRREDARFLRGAGRYVDDIRFEGQAYAVFLRSPVAHGVLRSVDTDAARARPGVLAVLTASDARTFGLGAIGVGVPFVGVDGAPAAPVAQPCLAEGRVRYVGQPIAMAVAETRAAALDAIEAINLDIEELPAVVDPRRALDADAPQLHDAAPENVAFRWRAGDSAATEAAFAAAAHRVSARAKSHRVVVNAMEPRAINAAYDADLGRWTVYCGTQGAHKMRDFLAVLLGARPEQIRLITPDVGGGFGMKLLVHPEYAVVCMAAHRLRRPVGWTADRSESFLADLQGRDLDVETEGAFDADGRLLAIRCRSVSGLGAYPSIYGVGVHTMFSGNLVGGLYRLPAFDNEVCGAFANTTPTDAYRGAGRPEIVYAAERLMAAAARRLALDPAEIRRRNLPTAADAPYAMAGGDRLDSCDCVAILDRALEAADYAGRAARRAEAAGRGRLLGTGVAYYMERTGGGPAETGRIRLRGDGRIEAWLGTQSTGQGHETAWIQLLCERLGVAPEAIDILGGDTDLLPLGGGTGGSRSLIQGHRVLFAAADHVIAQGVEAAAQALEAAPADIVFSSAEGGRFTVAGTDRSLSLAEAAAAAAEGEILGVGDVANRVSTFPNGAHVAEVEIDPETGRAELTRYTIVDDFGRILNPLLVAGQVHGGTAQGVGQALFEQARYDAETGQPQTGSFMDYALPRADDFPMFRTALDERAPATTNPLGVKGCGEAGAVGGVPAATLAVLDALAAAGVPDVDRLQTPLTPLAIWEALGTARPRAQAE